MEVSDYVEQVQYQNNAVHVPVEAGAYADTPVVAPVAMTAMVVLVVLVVVVD